MIVELRLFVKMFADLSIRNKGAIPWRVTRGSSTYYAVTRARLNAGLHNLKARFLARQNAAPVGVFFFFMV